MGRVAIIAALGGFTCLASGGLGDRSGGPTVGSYWCWTCHGASQVGFLDAIKIRGTAISAWKYIRPPVSCRCDPVRHSVAVIPQRCRLLSASTTLSITVSIDAVEWAPVVFVRCSLARRRGLVQRDQLHRRSRQLAAGSMAMVPSCTCWLLSVPATPARADQRPPPRSPRTNPGA